MDPFTSLGIACNILQLCGIAWKLSSGTHAIYTSLNGATTNTLALDAIVESVNALSGSISMANTDNISDRLERLCQLSVDVAAELTGILESLKATQSKRKWRQSFVVAWREIRTKKQIKEFADRLQQLQTQIVTELQVLVV